jgi:hypothetical protein
MSIQFNDVERLIMERWTEVTGLIEAHETLQDRLEEQIETVADRIGRWARPQGFDVDSSPRDVEINAWKPAWADRRKEPRVFLTVGGFYPIGFRRVDAAHPYLWVRAENLAEYRLRETQRTAFAHDLRAALGEGAREWEAHDVDDLEGPLGRYLSEYDDTFRAKLLPDSDALFDFCTKHFPTLFSLADVIDAQLQRLGTR